MNAPLTRDRIKPYGLSRSALAKLLDEHERLAAASKAAHVAFREAKESRQALPKALARKAAEAATAGEEDNLEEYATNVDLVAMAALQRANGIEDARAAAAGKIAAHLRSPEGAEDRAKVERVLEERRAAALKALEAARTAVADLAEAVAVVDALAERPAGVTTPIDVVDPAQHPLSRAVEDLTGAVRAAGPKAPTPKAPVGNGHAVAMTHAAAR